MYTEDLLKWVIGPHNLHCRRCGYCYRRSSVVGLCVCVSIGHVQKRL